MDTQTQMKIESAKSRARRNFSAGFNCAECIVEALLGELIPDLPPDMWKLSTGFGGGVGLYGDTCGALLGAVLAVSAVHGRNALPEAETRQDVLRASRQQLYANPGLYRIFNQVPNWFRDQNGSTLCRDLTEPWHDDWLCKEQALFCREIITETAGFAASLVMLTKQEIRSLRFGHVVERFDPGSTSSTLD